MRPNPQEQDAPVIGFSGTVADEWLDGNDHMNSMAYANLFWSNLSAVFGRIGITPAYPVDRRLTIFQGESHMRWERELRGGDPICIRSWVVAHDRKRIHHFHELWNEGAGYRAATVEYLSFHIDLASRRSAAMPDDVMVRLDALARACAAQPQPHGINGRISLDRGGAVTVGDI